MTTKGPNELIEVVKWINRLYILFLGIILAITSGFGIAAFYPQPVAPSYPSSYTNTVVPQSCYSTPQQQLTPECQQLIQKQQNEQQQNGVKQQQYQSDLEKYQNKNSSYTRTAIFFGIAIGAIYAIIGLGLIKVSKLVATGMLLAGVLTAILTRILITLASLGVSVTGTNEADTTAFLEFGVLFILSIAVIIVGLYSLRENETKTLASAPANPAMPPPAS